MQKKEKHVNEICFKQTKYETDKTNKLGYKCKIMIKKHQIMIQTDKQITTQTNCDSNKRTLIQTNRLRYKQRNESKYKQGLEAQRGESIRPAITNQKYHKGKHNTPILHPDK